MKNYRVVVGNIGTIVCSDAKHAKSVFNTYREQSKSGYGRAAGESVVLMEGDEIVREHVGSYPKEP